MSSERPMGPFMVVFGGQAFSLFGSRLVQFALVWWITETTGLASTLAFASIVAMLPQVLLGPFAGALVDRWNRKTVMMVSDSFIALVVVALAFLYGTGAIRLWHVYLAMFTRSLGGAFQWPAMQATTTMMVDRGSLSRVAGMNQSLQGMAAIVAPPLGAFLMQVMPIQTILLIDVATAVLAVGPLFFIKVPQPIRELTEMLGLKTVLMDMREGAMFVWRWRGLRIIMGMSMVMNFLMNPAFSLLPLVVTNHFNGGAVELGWLQSANGVGMIAGGLLLGAWGGFRKRIVTAMTSIIIGGVFIEAFSFMPPELFLVAVGCVFVFAVFNTIANGTFFSSMQAVIPPEMQGRVFTILMSLSGGMTPIGLAFAGPVSDSLGLFIWFRIGGVVVALIGAAAFFIPAVMNLEEEAELPQTEA
ncbi:MAG TPA: MFS transporter [Candidatus Krumholzibacteriaceae bacterium]|nr:MFS transporter [Candidatus Krumholzibacteriaceae bacterium]